jgi:hypothetical protein
MNRCIELEELRQTLEARVGKETFQELNHEFMHKAIQDAEIIWNPEEPLRYDDWVIGFYKQLLYDELENHPHTGHTKIR